MTPPVLLYSIDSTSQPFQPQPLICGTGNFCTSDLSHDVNKRIGIFPTKFADASDWPSLFANLNTLYSNDRSFPIVALNKPQPILNLQVLGERELHIVLKRRSISQSGASVDFVGRKPIRSYCKSSCIGGVVPTKRGPPHKRQRGEALRRLAWQY